MAKYLQSSENIPINETGDNISFDLSNEIKQLLGKIPNLEKTLLWTNPNPEQSMGTLNINLDLSNYNYIEIEYYTDTTMGSTCFTKGKIGKSMNLLSFSGSLLKYYVRTCTITSSQIQIQRNADPGVQYEDTKNIPYKIYGIH